MRLPELKAPFMGRFGPATESERDLKDPRNGNGSGSGIENESGIESKRRGRKFWL